ncbi:hypothetical protein QA596_09415 [Balneolales bacterium ANBcel1]|nr:hypothetical protein [Balneolales bacterium ANBcel1]
MINHLAFNWFLLFYSVLALLLLVQGMIWLLRPAPFYDYLRDAASSDRRPPMLLKSARYLLLFSTASLVFAFVLRSPVDIVFSLGLVSLSFTVSNLLTHWPRLRPAIPRYPDRLMRSLRYAGLFCLSTAMVLMLLIYRLAIMG